MANCEIIGKWINLLDQCKTDREVWECVEQSMEPLSIKQLIYVPHTERLLRRYTGIIKPKALPPLQFQDQLGFAFDQHIGAHLEGGSGVLSSRNTIASDGRGEGAKEAGDAGISTPIFGSLGLEAVVELCLADATERYSQYYMSLLRLYAISLHEKLVSTNLERVGLAAKLSPKEAAILASVVAGKSNASIGDKFNLTGADVEEYLARVFAKLEVTNRTSAAIKGVMSGLVSPAPQTGRYTQN